MLIGYARVSTDDQLLDLLVFHLFGALAEFERNLIRERTNAGLTAARTRGKTGGRPKALEPNQRALVVSLYNEKQHSLDEICQTVHINYLFSSEKTGEALTERGLRYLVKKYAHLASISDDLRHRFGYRMAQVVQIHRLAQIMGPDSLDMTTIYIRGTQGDLQREVEKIAWE